MLCVIRASHAMSSDNGSHALPRHIAIIMDGNGRWAEERGQIRLLGHKAGVASVREVVETARSIGIESLTLYAFSTENWHRPKNEVHGLMGLLQSYLASELHTLLKNDIRLCCLGDSQELPDAVRRILTKTISNTAHCKSMVLNLALNYGSRSEIVLAVQALVQACQQGKLDLEEIDEKQIAARLYTAGQPDPDLLIRTGGECRLSNFLLWQLSYAELYFTETKWPDFRRENLMAAIEEYARRQRRFGQTGAQLQCPSAKGESQ